MLVTFFATSVGHESETEKHTFQRLTARMDARLLQEKKTPFHKFSNETSELHEFDTNVIFYTFFKKDRFKFFS